MSTGAVDGLETRERPRVDVPLLVGWLLLFTLVGAVMWLVYFLTAWGGCPTPPDNSGLDMFGPTHVGGAVSGGALLTAAVLGVSLLVTSALTAAWARIKLRYVSLAFVVLYAVGLFAVLRPIAPLIWGPSRCVG